MSWGKLDCRETGQRNRRLELPPPGLRLLPSSASEARFTPSKFIRRVIFAPPPGKSLFSRLLPLDRISISRRGEKKLFPSSFVWKKGLCQRANGESLRAFLLLIPSCICYEWYEMLRSLSLTTTHYVVHTENWGRRRRQSWTCFAKL